MAAGEHRAAGEAALSPAATGSAASGSATLPGDARRVRLLVFVAALVGFGALFLALPVLYDTDSYYHLAIGRAYLEHGLIDQLPWARLSLMFDGFGDKEPLFHLFLAPFAAFGTTGGRLALALLNAGLFALLAGYGARQLGWKGLLLPLLAYAGSLDFLGRAVRLRPEQLSLLLLLVLVPAAAARRWRLVAVLAFLYTLAYTAFHALLGLTFLFFLYDLWRERRADWRPLLYPWVGCALALVLHPQFPHNLLIFKVQSVDFFRYKAILDVGNEIAAATTARMLSQNWPWLLALLCCWRAREPRRPAASTTSGEDALAAARRRQADLLLIAAAVFGGLYLLMQRFSTYAIPFCLVLAAAEAGRRGLRIGERIRLPFRGSLPLWLGLAVALLPGLGRSAWQLYGMAQEAGPLGREAEWAEFGRAVPAGAKVAAEWGLTHVYMYFAPQASYLDVLDPVFMALPYPDAYAAQRELFEGRASDVAMVVKAELDSDYLAFSRFHRAPRLLERLAGDPRWEAVYQGYTLLYRLVPGRNHSFLLDWQVLPPGATPLALLPPYPRRERPEERELEAFVDLRRVPVVDARGCAALTRSEEATAPRTAMFELAAAGPTRLLVDGREVVAAAGDGGALLGEGLVFPLALEPGSHLMTVYTCPPRDRQNADAGGFYLRRLSPGPESAP